MAQVLDEIRQRLYLEAEGASGAKTICYLGQDPVLIGSGENADLRPDGPGVMPEHALVTLEQQHVWLENLSSAGTYLGNRRVVSRTLITPGETFGMGEGCFITLKQTGKTARSGSANIVFPVLLVLIVLAGIAVNVSKLRQQARQDRPITEQNWQEAFLRLSRHLRDAQEKGLIDASFVESFSQAWFRERSGDRAGALAAWHTVFNAMTGLSVEGVTPPGCTIATAAGGSPAVLYMFMGRDWQHDPDAESAWKNLDRAYLNALWWFVSMRIEQLRDNPGQ